MQRFSGWFCDRRGGHFAERRRLSLTKSMIRLSRTRIIDGQASAASFGPDTREHGTRVSGSIWLGLAFTEWPVAKVT